MKMGGEFIGPMTMIFTLTSCGNISLMKRKYLLKKVNVYEIGETELKKRSVITDNLILRASMLIPYS